MFARLQLLGTGETDDPFRVDLPNYSMVTVDYAAMWAVVSMSSRDGPQHPPAQGSPLYPLEGSMYVLIGLSPEDLAAWWAYLARRYPGRDPEPQPNFA
jgi:hypothetical protein